MCIGVIGTKLGRHMNYFQLIVPLISVLWRGQRFKSIEQGAATTVTVATAPEIKQGAYYADCLVAEETANAKLDEDNAALFDCCDEVTMKCQ
jgi:hypothetical protein